METPNWFPGRAARGIFNITTFEETTNLKAPRL